MCRMNCHIRQVQDITMQTTTTTNAVATTGITTRTHHLIITSMPSKTRSSAGFACRVLKWKTIWWRVLATMCTWLFLRYPLLVSSMTSSFLPSSSSFLFMFLLLIFINLLLGRISRRSRAGGAYRAPPCHRGSPSNHCRRNS